MNGGSFTHHDQQRRQQSRRDADEQSGGEAGRERPSLGDEQVAGDDAGERDHGARREIDAAGNDHDRRADRGDAVDRRVLQDQQRVLGVEERMRAAGLRPQIPGEEQHLGDQDRDGAQLADRAQPLHRRSPSSSGVAVDEWRRCITSSSVAIAPRSSPCSSPSFITRMRSASARISGRSLDTTSTARPVARLLPDHFVDLELRADVHALGRLVEQQHARLGRHPLGDDDLLLVAAAERVGQRVDAGGLDAPVARASRAASRRSSLASISSVVVRACAFGITRLLRRSRLKSSPCR